MSTAGKSRSAGGPRVLVVRLGAMGDVLHSLPAVATLKHGFPGCTLTWIVRPRWAPLLEGNPYVDRIVPFDRSSFHGLRSAWRALRSQRYDFAVDFQGLVQSAVIASLARADRIYGFHFSVARERVASALYSHKVKTTPSAHIVDQNLELAAAAGASARVVTFPVPQGVPEGDLPEGGFVLANPFAGWAGKQWPPEHYAALARRLRDELGLPLVVNGAPDAAPSLARIDGAIVHISGLPGLIHATRKAVAVIGVDSGPTHLAAALGRPGVAVFGPTDPARNGPYGDTMSVLRSRDAVTTYKRWTEPHPTMRAVSPGDVFDALRKSLTRGKSAECCSG